MATIALPAFTGLYTSRVLADGASFNFSTVIVAPGQSFQVDLGITATHPWSGFSVYFNAPASSLFTVTSHSLAASDNLFSAGDSNLAGSSPWSIPASGNSADFGYTNITNNSAGTYDIETLTFQTLAAVQNNTAYTLATTVGAAGSETFQVVGTNVSEFALSPASISVTTLVPTQATISNYVQLDALSSGAAMNITSTGKLQVGDGAASGQLSGARIFNSGILAFDRSDVAVQTASISGAGTVTQLGPGTTTLTTAASYSGPTIISAGTLDFSGSVAHSIGAVTGVAALQVDQGATPISDSVNLLNGTWTINGTQVIRSSSMAGAYAMHYYGQDTTVLSGTSVVSNLTFGAGAKLDLQNNALIVEATSSNKVSLLAQIATDVTQGYITSSSVATNSAYTLVVALDNSNINASKFGGVPVDSNSIIVTEALKGDANLDGYVDLTDFNIWLGNLGTSTSAYAASTGDLNSDGYVDLTDFNVWLSNLGHFIGADPAPALALGSGASTAGATTTPEPASVTLLGLGALGLLTRRRASRR